MCPIPGGCPEGGCKGCIHGTATSPDGVAWENPQAVKWPKPQRYDCHTNMFYDQTEAKYVITTRDYISEERDIAISRSKDEKFGGWESPTKLIESGDRAHQLYSQITFPFANIYLGIVMIYDAPPLGAPGQHVHCRLSWSPTVAGPWAWVDHDQPMPGTEFIPAGVPGSFDSHICFAAHMPVQTPQGVRVYYMGGNGPHSGARNSSFAMATVRTDGFVGVTSGAQQGHIITRSVNVTGATLYVSADVPLEGEVQIGAVGIPGLGMTACKALQGVGSVTDQQVGFDGKDFSAFVGQMVQMELRITKATVFTLSFK
jgi:hypothetical protein